MAEANREPPALRRKPKNTIAPKPSISIAQVEGSGVETAVMVPSIAMWIGDRPLTPESSAKYEPALRMSGLTVASWPPVTLLTSDDSISAPMGWNGDVGALEVKSLSESTPPVIR